MYWEMELSFHNLKKTLIFQEGANKAPEGNKKSAPKKFLVSFDIFVIFTAVKHKKIPREYFYRVVKHTEIPCDYLYSIVKHKEIRCYYVNVM